MYFIHSDLPFASPNRRESSVSYGLDIHHGVFYRIDCWPAVAC